MAWGSQLAAGTASAITQNINSRYDMVKKVSDEIVNVVAVSENIDNINNVANNKTDIDTVAGNIDHVVDVAENTFPPSATAPTTRPNGDQLIAGDTYFNTSVNTTMLWNGSSWVRGGGQASDVGTSKGYGIGYTVAISAVEDIVVASGTNGFSIDNFELVDGASLTIEDGATYKVI